MMVSIDTDRIMISGWLALCLLFGGGVAMWAFRTFDPLPALAMISAVLFLVGVATSIERVES